MLKINKQSITLTKGDDASLRLVPRYKDKTIYTVQEGDSAVFRLKVGASVKELECVINLENNKIVVNFTPADTKDFEPGIYRYEAELITSLGFHYTFIADQPFILGNEIEQRLSNATSANGNSNGNYPEIDGEIGDEPVVNGDIQPTNPMMDYEELNHLPKLNGKTIKGNHDNAYYGIPTKTSELDNDSDFVSDDEYVHTDNNFSDEYKGVIDNLGTASGYNVPVSGNAGNDEVVLGNDTRLSDARPASDVSSWAKAPNKPTYSASEVGAIPSTDKGSANGVAELDANGKVPSAQLPAYVDDVLEYASVSAFPETGESGKIYIALDTNKTYRWGGSAYAEISESLALGETSSTAYRGDKGKTAYDHATETKLSTATASGLYKVASTAQGHIAGLTPVEKSDITALGIPAQDTTYNDATTSASGLMSANDKTKLNGIANGAQVNVQSDFAQTNTSADDFIKNKPTKVSDFTNDSGFTKVESSTTNGNIKINGTETQVYDDSEIKGELTTDESTIEGNPINFTTKSAQNAKSTILSVEPIQDLHGYDKPWVGGAGKNKFGGEYNEMFELFIQSGTIVTAYSDVNSSINYYKQDGETRIDYWSVTNSGRTFTLIEDAYYFKFSGASSTPTKMYIAIEDTFSGYAPYENICAITGRTQDNILGCGKNICFAKLQNTNINSAGTLSADNAYSMNVAKVYKNVTYTLAMNENQSVYGFFASNPEIGDTSYDGQRIVDTSSKTFVAPIDGYIAFRSLNSSVSYTMCVIGSVAPTVYEPYTLSNDINISFGDTVYGAKLDVGRGLLVVDSQIVDLGSLSWNYETQYKRFYSTMNDMAYVTSLSAKPNFVCSAYNPVSINDFNSDITVSGTIRGNDGGNRRIYIRDLRYTDASDFTTAINGQTLVYEIVTPITIEVTPHQIALLEGINNISTDGDKITLTYRDGSVATLGDVKALGDEMSQGIADSQILTDTVTGDKYKLVVTSGVLSIEQISN